MPLSPDTNAPLPHESCGAVLNPHIEFLSQRRRWLLATFFRARFPHVRSNFLRRRGLLLRRGGFLRRVPETPSGGGKRLFKVIEIEPPLRKHAFPSLVFP